MILMINLDDNLLVETTYSIHTAPEFHNILEAYETSKMFLKIKHLYIIINFNNKTKPVGVPHPPLVFSDRFFA